VFTAGATEANNTALAAVAARPDGRRHVVATAVEHPSVDAALAVLEAGGCAVTRVRVGRSGRVAVADVAAALRADTALVTAIWANNETGVVQPIEEIAQLAAERGAWMHSDATQAVGKHAIAPARLPIDLLSLSAHKFGGPKGVGCLVVRGGIALPPFLRGGPQERGRRGGTENLAGIAGLGVACELARRELPERIARHAQLRDRLWDGIAAKVPTCRATAIRARAREHAEPLLPRHAGRAPAPGARSGGDRGVRGRRVRVGLGRALARARGDGLLEGRGARDAALLRSATGPTRRRSIACSRGCPTWCARARGAGDA
jgi:cysteine desulfurase